MLARGILIFISAIALPGTAFAQQTDYSAGKTPQQLFSGDCSSCHQSPRGLAKSQDQRGLTSFLREHYTTRPETAGALAAFLLSNPGPAPAEARHPGEPRNRRATTAKPNQPAEGAGIMAPEPGSEEKPARAAAKPPERGAKPRRPTEAAASKPDPKPEHERAGEVEKTRESAKPDSGKEAAAKAEAAKAEAAKVEAAKAADEAKAQAAKAEAARVRAYATGGDEARPGQPAVKPDGETK